MDEQTAFDKIWNHFITEGNPPSFSSSTPSGTFCAYRGAQGAKCAIGVLIPDEVYTEEFEDLSLARILEVCDLNIGFNFACALQCAHDTSAQEAKSHDDFKEGMKANLIAIADEHFLTIPV